MCPWKKWTSLQKTRTLLKTYSSICLNILVAKSAKKILSKQKYFFLFLFYLEEKEERELQLEERDPDLEEDEEAEDPLPSCHENLHNSILYIL